MPDEISPKPEPETVRDTLAPQGAAEAETVLPQSPAVVQAPLVAATDKGDVTDKNDVAVPAAPPVPSAPSRFTSLDALRGFDMFWIIGMEELAEAVAKTSTSPVVHQITTQLTHVPWAGFHFLDLIFPLFVFITGASMVFSLQKNRAQHGAFGALWRLWRRCLLIYVLGLFCYGGISKGIDGIRWLGVLQRLAITGGLAGMAYLVFGPRMRWALIAVLLIGYWVVMKFLQVGPVPVGAMEPTQNVAAWIDSVYLPGYKWNGTWDPEGLLSTIPAVGSALLGMAAAEWWQRGDRSAAEKVKRLMIAGAMSAVVGWIWHFHFPVIKNIWTSSFVLVAAGYSALLLGAFAWLIEVKGWKAWAAPFVWIGLNPITLYMAHHVFKFDVVAERIGGGPVAAYFGEWSHVWMLSLVVLIGVAMAGWMHWRKIYLRF